MSKKSKMEEVRDAIKARAKELDIEPHEVTKKDLYGIVTDYTFKVIGGLDLVKKKYFPFEDKDHKEIFRAKTSISYVTKLETELGKLKNQQEVLETALSKLNVIKVKPYKINKSKKISRAVNVILSDLHIGSDINAEETGRLNFGRVEEARRLARITKEIIDYKPQYRKDTKLNILLLGDEIQGQLHDDRDGAPTTEQVIRCIHLLGQSFSHLVQNYPKISVYCNSGNHSRRTARHKTRATNQKWDSYETIIAYALKKMFANSPNIEFIIPKTPYVEYEVFGKKIFASHGDTVLKPGYPGKSISTGSLENQINKINAALSDQDEYSVVICGHVHTGSITHLANGAVMITNGAMVPVDEYAVSIGMIESAAGQYLFESVEGYPVGDCRYIRVSEVDDKNPELDKIIKPFESF